MIGFLEQALTAKEVAFEVAVFNPQQRLNLTALLWNADGSARFRGYFM